MKKLVPRLIAVVVPTVFATFFTALMMKAAIGTYACWDALSMNIAELTGLKVASFSMIMNTLCVLLQILMLRREFPLTKLIQIPYVLFFSTMVNFFYYHVLTFERPGYPGRFALCLISVVGVSFFVGIVTALNLVTLSVETTCSIASGKYHFDFAVLRISIDVLCIVASLLLTFRFGLTFTIREGTVVAMALLGPLENRYIKKFRIFAKNHPKLLDFIQAE